MPKKGFQCPNCGSEFCTAIFWWKPRKDMVDGVFDAYKCHDCEQLTEAGTNRELPSDWQPPRKVVQAQPDLFGKVQNIRETIKIVPKMIETPAGLSVCVIRAPDGSTAQYMSELESMAREINRRSTGRKVPDWYKYRRIKRGRKE